MPKFVFEFYNAKKHNSNFHREKLNISKVLNINFKISLTVRATCIYPNKKNVLKDCFGKYLCNSVEKEEI